MPAIEGARRRARPPGGRRALCLRLGHCGSDDGHAEGFADTFRELYRNVYRAVASGVPGSDYPTFRAGHVENGLGEAIAESNRDGRWVEVSQ
jgi:predicted dehydrogenase